jgi:Na+(H+)/acetate symporter ActP
MLRLFGSTTAALAILSVAALSLCIDVVRNVLKLQRAQNESMARLTSVVADQRRSARAVVLAGVVVIVLSTIGSMRPIALTDIGSIKMGFLVIGVGLLLYLITYSFHRDFQETNGGGPTTDSTQREGQ